MIQEQAVEASQALRHLYGDQTPEVGLWHRPGNRRRGADMWLHATPRRCRRLIYALRWIHNNREDLLMLATGALTILGAAWLATILI